MSANFWDIVIDELEYQGKTRKWLASEVQIDVSTIGMGAKRGSMPQVDLALKIAAVLEVPVEYLVTGKIRRPKTMPKAKICTNITSTHAQSTI